MCDYALPHFVLYEAGLPFAAVNVHTKEIEGGGLRRACSFGLPFGSSSTATTLIALLSLGSGTFRAVLAIACAKSLCLQ